MVMRDWGSGRGAPCFGSGEEDGGFFSRYLRRQKKCRCHTGTDKKDSREVRHLREYHPLRKGWLRSSLCPKKFGCPEGENCCSAHGSRPRWLWRTVETSVLAYLTDL